MYLRTLQNHPTRPFTLPGHGKRTRNNEQNEVAEQANGARAKLDPVSIYVAKYMKLLPEEEGCLHKVGRCSLHVAHYKKHRLCWILEDHTDRLLVCL